MGRYGLRKLLHRIMKWREGINSFSCHEIICNRDGGNRPHETVPKSLAQHHNVIDFPLFALSLTYQNMAYQWYTRNIEKLKHWDFKPNMLPCNDTSSHLNFQAYRIVKLISIWFLGLGIILYKVIVLLFAYSSYMNVVPQVKQISLSSSRFHSFMTQREKSVGD
jgi:hypothetical protein